MHGGGRHSNQVVRRLGARITAGLRTPDAPPLHRWVPYDRNQPEIVRYLEVVSLVGAPITTLEPRLPVVESDLAEAERAVPDDGRPLVALHPGARHPERRWPAERFAAVGDALVAAGARVVVTGTEAEGAVVRQLLDAMRQPAESACGLLSLRGLLGLYSRCAVVLSNDTGALHLARAAGAPTVGIYWAFNLVPYGPLSRTRHRVAVSWRDHRRLCRPDCTDPYCERCEPFVADVPVDEVRDQALDLFMTSTRSGCPGTRGEALAGRAMH
jgi:ADP-heptose:LPS heptosyltransferase